MYDNRSLSLNLRSSMDLLHGLPGRSNTYSTLRVSSLDQLTQSFSIWQPRNQTHLTNWSFDYTNICSNAIKYAATFHRFHNITSSWHPGRTESLIKTIQHGHEYEKDFKMPQSNSRAHLYICNYLCMWKFCKWSETLMNQCLWFSPGITHNQFMFKACWII